MTDAPSLSATGGFAQAARFLRASWLTLLLIAAINTSFAALLWIDDPRPFWHPFLTVQLYGFSIAACVRAAVPWEKPQPLLRLMAAVAAGTAIGFVLVLFAKGYTLAYVEERARYFALTVLTGFANGLFVSLFFYVKQREARAETRLHRLEAERHLAARHALEAELKLMQAQVEPHFLFNTLASVQYLTETDPPRASQLLQHLIAYLRAALPQLRSGSSTLGQEVQLAEAYLGVLATRMGPRLAFGVAVPEELRDHPFPPTLLVSLVENAVKHGLEPMRDGGTVTVQARRDGDRLVVLVSDTGRGLAAGGAPAAQRSEGSGIGLANIRERLAALYGRGGRFTLEDASPRGCRATIEIPAVTP